MWKLSANEDELIFEFVTNDELHIVVTVDLPGSFGYAIRSGDRFIPGTYQENGKCIENEINQAIERAARPLP